MTKKILIITTNFSEINEDIHTGVWLEEFAVPFLVFKATGFDITVASPMGGESPIDENSLSCSNPMEWDDAAKYLKDTIPLSAIDYELFDVLFIPGGHGPMFDLAINETVKKIVEYFYNNEKLIASVCHGPAALINAKDKNGDSILKNRSVTAFTNKEEEIVKMREFMPFSLEDKLKETGANFKAEKPWSEHVEISSNIITGQNQNSALLVAEKVIMLL